MVLFKQAVIKCQKKTKYLVIQSPQQQCDLSNLYITINEINLERIGKDCKEQSTKFLGVYIDENLSWKAQISHMNTNISRSLYMLKQVKHCLPMASLRTLYYTLIHPHITYGILAWGRTTQKHLESILKLQKKAIRVLNKANYNSHTDPLFKQSNILKVGDQYKYEAMIFMHNFLGNKLPKSFDQVFQLNRDVREVHETRQSNLIYMKRCDSEFSKRLPLYSIPTLWNQFQVNIHALQDLSIFQAKRSIKKALISVYLDSVRCRNPNCKDCINTA